MVAATFPQRWGEVVKTLAHQVCSKYYRNVSRMLPQCYRQKKVVRKQLHNFMATFIQRKSVSSTIFTMLWQPF